MLCSDRRGFLAGLGALGLMAGCGFSPVYGPDGAGRALRGAVRADDPASRADFQFVAAFEDLLGRPESPRFALAYTIALRNVSSGDIQDIGATRIQRFGTLEFTVTELATGATVATGEVSNNTTYSTTGTQLATMTAAEDAELRLMRILAEALVTRLYTEPGLAAAATEA
ncbi:MAG: twin-arginine translocation signal domain-containing protein [Rhodobacteraceae bacterium]|jgi:LPS-assembly lipoprotein|nr:twin-arginine translocation signal domain-containing protein [Paracoccaceae bacterium]